MKLILLGGNGIENKKWLETVEQLLKPLFESTKVVNYDHWQTGGYLINLDKEKEKLTQIANNFGKFIIFAKSAGILVTLKAISENKISPEHCLFVGIPINWAKENNFNIDVWFKNYSVSTIILQHSKDPLMSFKEAKNYLKQEKVINTQLKELPGDTHDYNEFKFIQKLTKDLLK